MKTFLLTFVASHVVAMSVAFAHGPDQAPHQIADLGEFQLEGGGVIDNLRMSYVTHGTLSEAKDNAILFMHGFAANHHIADHLIGPGKALDTDKYFVIASDTFGSTQTDFEHSTSATSSGLGMKFPAFNGRDLVNAERKLITDGLARIFQCAVQRRGPSVGESPTRHLSLQPVAIGAAVEATKRSKPSV